MMVWNSSAAKGIAIPALKKGESVQAIKSDNLSMERADVTVYFSRHSVYRML